MENPIALAILAASILVILAVTYFSRKHTATTRAFYVADNKIPWKLNGMAMIGEYMSAASFLGVAGAVALMGVDGWWLATGFFAAWIVVLLLAAGPLKSVGKFTVGDVLSARFFESKQIKMLAMLSTLIISGLYLVPQMVGAGHLFNLLLGWDYLPTVIVTGSLMAAIVIFGGMRGTTINQAIQGVVLWSAMIFILVFVTIIHFGGNVMGIVDAGHTMVPPHIAVEEASAVIAEIGSEDAGAVIEATREAMPDAPNALTPGVGLRDGWNQLSLVLGLFFGVLGLPHILTRFFVVKDANDARKGAEMAIWAFGAFYAAVVLVGIGAMYVLYPTLIELLAAGERGAATNLAVPMLGDALGGQVFLGIIAAGAMAAMLSTSAGLLIVATTSLAHDVYGEIIKPESSDRERVIFAKVGAGVMTIGAIGMAIFARDENVAILVAMTFGIAASTFAPALLLSIWWRRLTLQGVVYGMAVGLVVSLVFTAAVFFDVDAIVGIPVFVNPALYSVPLAFLVTILVSLGTKDTGSVDEFMAMAHGHKEHSHKEE